MVLKIISLIMDKGWCFGILIIIIAALELKFKWLPRGHPFSWIFSLFDITIILILLSLFLFDVIRALSETR